MNSILEIEDSKENVLPQKENLVDNETQENVYLRVIIHQLNIIVGIV